MAVNTAPFDKKALVDEYYQTGCLPRAGRANESKIAQMVYALTEHAVGAYKSWYQAGDEDRRYYKGDQLSKTPKWKSKIVDNECLVVVDTLAPRIIDSVASSDILPMNEDDLQAARSLGQRVEWAMRKCVWNRQRHQVVHDMLLEGGSHIKLFDDVSAYRLQPRRLVREPEASSFDTANYYIDQVISSVAETVKVYGKKAKSIVPQISELEADENSPSGPVVVRSGNDISVYAPVEQSSPVYRYISNTLSEKFDKVKRVLRYEMYVRDNSIEKSSEPLAGEDGEILLDNNGEPVMMDFETDMYPEGRIVTIAIGAKDSGEVDNGEDPALTVLQDRPNPYTRLYQETKRFPLIEVLLNDTDEVWSQSVIRPIIPMQDALNRTWNQMGDNAALVINSKPIIHPMSGIKKDDLTNEPGQMIFMGSAATIPPKDAIYYPEFPPIIQHLSALIAMIKDAIRNISGVLDVTRGEKPGGVTAASAINLLQIKADNRIVIKAERLSYAERQIKEGLAYIAQEFDLLEQSIVGRDTDDTYPDESVMSEEKYISYNPDETRDIAIRVVGTRKKSTEELIALLSAVADLESKGVPGELLLIGEDDPRLYEMYVQKKKEREAMEMMMQRQQQAQMVEQQKRDAETKVSADIAKSILGGGQGNAVPK